MHSLPEAFNLNLITMPARVPAYNAAKIQKMILNDAERATAAVNHRRQISIQRVGLRVW
jgi:hypothetical protein